MNGKEYPVLSELPVLNARGAGLYASRLYDVQSVAGLWKGTILERIVIFIRWTKGGLRNSERLASTKPNFIEPWTSG